MLKKQRNLTEKCKKSFIGWKLPHTYVILTIILLVVVGLTYIIPGGEYDRVIDPANGKTIVLPDSFHFGEGNRPDFFDIFLSVSRGYVSAADILFLIGCSLTRSGKTEGVTAGKASVALEPKTPPAP